MDKSRLKIVTNGIWAEISIDGKKIEGVRKYSIKQEAGNIPVVELEMVNMPVDFETHVLPKLPFPWSDLYVEKPHEWIQESG